MLLNNFISWVLLDLLLSDIKCTPAQGIGTTPESGIKVVFLWYSYGIGCEIGKLNCPVDIFYFGNVHGYMFIACLDIVSEQRRLQWQLTIQT